MTIFRDRGDGASGPYQGIDNVSVAVPGASVSVTISATNSSGTMATGTFGRLYCTSLLWDSSRELSVVAGMHEQADTTDLQAQELASL